MKPSKLFFCVIALVCACSLTTTLNAQCCRVPDSLKVTNVTDTSFCLHWSANDSIPCDTAKAFEVKYRPVGTTVWKFKQRSYSGAHSFTWCDTGTSCTQYEWKVRNICIKNGDSTFTAYATGPNFTTKCDTSHFALHNSTAILQSLHQVQITPNPAKDKIVLTGKYSGAVQISISSMTGKQMIHVQVNTFDNKLSVPIITNSFEKGIYFISITDKTGTLKQSFIKQ